MRVTAEHWQILIEFAEGNPGIITNKFNGAQGKAGGNAMWHTVANSLNGLGYGQKTVTEEWRKTVTDWKSKVKGKAAKIRISAAQTGGGAPAVPILTPLEERLLAIMGTKSLEGDFGIPEFGLPGTSKDQMSLSPAPPSPEVGVIEEHVGVVMHAEDHNYTPIRGTKRKEKSSTSNRAKNRAEAFVDFLMIYHS